jgi:hypothetical protein
MTTLRHITDVIPAEAGIHDTFQRGCAFGDVVNVEACVDGGLRRHDGSGEFMAETQKLIGISLEGSVG